MRGVQDAACSSRCSRSRCSTCKSRAGLDAIRGVPPKLRRLPALQLSLAGCAGVVIFGVLLVLADFGANFNPYRRCRTDIVLGSGFYVSLAGYALATIASLLLPATSSE
jgi:hypothetical protein